MTLLTPSLFSNRGSATKWMAEIAEMNAPSVINLEKMMLKRNMVWPGHTHDVDLAMENVSGPPCSQSLYGTDLIGLIQ